jgi:hypothetical protein
MSSGRNRRPTVRLIDRSIDRSVGWSRKDESLSPIRRQLCYVMRMDGRMDGWTGGWMDGWEQEENELYGVMC